MLLSNENREINSNTFFMQLTTVFGQSDTGKNLQKLPLDTFYAGSNPVIIKIRSTTYQEIFE